MPRKPRVIRPTMKNISLPEDLVAKVELRLMSELECKVPHGAWAELVGKLLREWLGKQGVQA